MTVLYLMVPVALVLAGAGVAAFLWSVRNGQYDDVETPAIRVLIDDESAFDRADRAERTASDGASSNAT